MALRARRQHLGADQLGQGIEVEAIAAVADHCRARRMPSGKVDAARDTQPIAGQGHALGLGFDQILDPGHGDQLGGAEPGLRLGGIAGVAGQPGRQPDPIERGRRHRRHHRDQQQHGQQGGAAFLGVDGHWTDT